VPSERIQRRIDHLLDRAEAAIDALDWGLAKQLCEQVLTLAADNADPTVYRQRLSGWEKQVTAHGARDFKVVLEPDRLAELLDEG